MTQYYQLPNEMGLDGLKPKDQLTYVCLRSYMNGKTMECYPSLQTLADLMNCSINTVRSSLDRLEKSNYISSRKEGRKKIYAFNKLVKFEPFSKEFLENDKISFETKAFVASAQQHMIKDIEGYGLTSYSNRDIASKLNISESSVRKYNNELKTKNLLDVVKNVSRDLESGCKTETKIYRLRDLGQAIIWKLKEHDEQINKNTDDISEIKKQLDSQSKLLESQAKLIDALLKAQQQQNPEFKID